MSIPQDTYFTVTPATNPRSKATGTLSGVDYFFYVAENGDLRVKTFSGVQSYTLDANTMWVDTVQGVDTIHVYYSNRSGIIFYIPFQQFGQGNGAPVNTGISGANVTFSANYAPNSVPPAYLIIVDDAVNHNLYVSGSPDFSTIIGTKRVYSNSVDLIYYTTKPTISVHMQDTNIATVNVNQIRISDGHSKVGFYVVQIPGVV